jgi:UDP-glucose 4-epimerase
MTTEQPRLLVTGVAGFIGTSVARLAIERGYEVHGVDLSTAPALTIAGVHDHRVARGHEGFASLLAEIRPQLCIHAAGVASVSASLDHPDEDFRAGPTLTFAVLDAIRRVVPNCQLIFLSSAAVYGNPQSLPVSEAHVPAPVSPYGFHKLQCEILCREFADIYGLNTAIARVFSAYGEGLRRQVLWDISQKILCEHKLVLRGTGEETRDFLHVRDIATGLMQIVAGTTTAAEVYNLASGSAVSIGDLAKMAISALGVDIKPEFDGFVPPGYPLHWRADVSRVAALGFAPTISLTAGVRSYAEWARQQLMTR